MTAESDLIDRLYADLPDEYEGLERVSANVVRGSAGNPLRYVVAWYGENREKAIVAMPVTGERILRGYFVDNAGDLFDQWLGDQHFYMAERVTVRQSPTIAVGVPCKGQSAWQIVEIDDSIATQAGTCVTCGQRVVCYPVGDELWAPCEHTVTKELPRLEGEA